MFLILQQGMGGMMYIEEDDLCSHDFSVSNTSAFEIWQQHLLLFEILQCYFNGVRGLPKFAQKSAQDWKSSFLIFSS